MSKNKNWFRMKAVNDTAEIEIFDEIDSFWGIGPKEFKEKLDEIKGSKSIKLMINSPGGSVFDGMAIYNMLAVHRDKLEVEVIGLAASIASIIALAGSKLTIADGAYLMIHNPWTFAAGGSADLRKTADILDKMKGDFVSIYAKKSGMSDDEIAKLMDDETWMTSSEAMDYGFADESVDYGEIAAKASSFGLNKYGFAHVPEMLARDSANEKPNGPRELETVLRDVGFSKRDAVAIVANGWKAIAQGEPSAAQGEPVEPEIETHEQIKLRMQALLAEQGIEIKEYIDEV